MVVMETNRKVCGNCRWNRKDWTDRMHSRFYCGCEESFAFGQGTAFGDGCEDWEPRDNERRQGK